MITDYFIDEVMAIRERESTVTNIRFVINFDSVNMDKTKLDIYYTFSSIYEDKEGKKVGEIRIIGHLINVEDNEESARIIKNYYDTKKSFPKAVLDKILNVLNFECGARGTLVAYAMAFPPPLIISSGNKE